MTSPWQVALAAALALAGCADPRQPSERAQDSISTPAIQLPVGDSGRIPDTLLVLNGVALRAESASVRHLLGAPLTTSSEDDTQTLGYIFTTWTYSNLEVTFADSTVAYITCSSGTCALPLGIGLGTRREDVEARLGAPGVTPRPTAAAEARYVGQTWDCGITLTYHEDRVATIGLWCDYS